VPKREAITGGWRTLYHKKLRELYFLPNVIWVVESGRVGWAKNVACMGGSAYRLLIGKAKGKRPHGRPRHRWEDTGP
jgi:hypothetical protein